MKAGYTVDRIIKVWDDESGEHVYVGPDADGFDCVELRHVDSTGSSNIHHRFTMTPDIAVIVANAILELYGPKV